MNEENTPSDSTALPDEDPLAGEPIKALRELEEDTSPFFLRAIRRNIHRRTAASHLLSFSWQLPKVTFVEMESMLIHILRTLSIQKED